MCLVAYESLPAAKWRMKIPCGTRVVQLTQLHRKRHALSSVNGFYVQLSSYSGVCDTQEANYLAVQIIRVRVCTETGVSTENYIGVSRYLQITTDHFVMLTPRLRRGILPEAKHGLGRYLAEHTLFYRIIARPLRRKRIFRSLAQLTCKLSKFPLGYRKS